MSENKRNLTPKEEYYKLITDEKSNHIETNANGAGSQCVRRKNIGSLSFRERYLSLRLPNLKPADFQRVFLFFPLEVTNVASATTVPNKIFLFIITALFLFL